MTDPLPTLTGASPYCRGLPNVTLGMRERLETVIKVVRDVGGVRSRRSRSDGSIGSHDSRGSGRPKIVQEADSPKSVRPQGVIPLVPPHDLAAAVDIDRRDESSHPLDGENESARLVIKVGITGLAAPMRASGVGVDRVEVIIVGVPRNHLPRRGIAACERPSRADQIVELTGDGVVGSSRYQAFFPPPARHGRGLSQHLGGIGSKGNVCRVGNVVRQIVARSIDKDPIRVAIAHGDLCAQRIGLEDGFP